MHRMVVMVLSAALAWLALPALSGMDNPEPVVRVILIDGQNNHAWRLTTPVLVEHLLACKRFQVDVSSHLKAGDTPGKLPTVPFPPALSKYDVVVSNYNGAPWPAAFRKELHQRVHEGKLGLVIVHAANNSFPDWPEYNEMIGMGWRAAGFGDRLVVNAAGKEVRVARGVGPGSGHGRKHAFRITVRNAEHPITRGMPREWMHSADELYHGMRGPVRNVQVLATAYSNRATGGTGEHEPMIWTVRYGKGRVFHTPMGHDVEGMRCVGFRATLQRGTEWAATGLVSVPLPEKFPTADRSSAIPARDRP